MSSLRMGQVPHLSGLRGLGDTRSPEEVRRQAADLRRQAAALRSAAAKIPPVAANQAQRQGLLAQADALDEGASGLEAGAAQGAGAAQDRPGEWQGQVTSLAVEAIRGASDAFVAREQRRAAQSQGGGYRPLPSAYAPQSGGSSGGVLLGVLGTAAAVGLTYALWPKGGDSK